MALGLLPLLRKFKTSAERSKLSFDSDPTMTIQETSYPLKLFN